MNAISFGAVVRERPGIVSDESKPGQPLDAAWIVLDAANEITSGRLNAGREQRTSGELGRVRANLLPAQRRAALLLLVHGRLHRGGLPIAHAGGPGAL